MADEGLEDAVVDVEASVVARLIAAQFPAWRDLLVERVDSAGTDNSIFRLGGEMCVRLPRVGRAVGQVEKEQR